MNKQNELYGIVAIVILVILMFGGCWSYRLGQKDIEDKYSNNIHTQKIDSVKLLQMQLDSILAKKAISDKKSQKLIDSTNNYVKIKQAQNLALNNHIVELNKKVAELTGKQKLTLIDSLVSRDTIYAIECILEAPAKDSTIKVQSQIIKGQREIIEQDNTDGTIDNIALQKCLEANKSKAGLIAFDENNKPKHPAWKKFLAAVEKPYIWSITGIAIIETGILYLTHK